MRRGLLSGRAARPCFDRLRLKELHQRDQVLLLIIGLQRFIIGAAILLIDDGGWIVVNHQPVVQQRPPHAPVSIRKGMDVFKAGVEIRPCLQRGFRTDGVDFLNQLRKVALHLIGLRTALILAGHIVVLLEFAGAFTVHNVAAFIIGSLRQRTVYDTDQLDGQRLFCNDFV